MEGSKAERGGSVLLEAERFEEYGGWLLDSQFEKDMGSAYLLAHGLGAPVAGGAHRCFWAPCE